MKSSFSAKSNIEEIEMAVNETEGFNVDDMQWMAVRDMLIFERFEDFYIDLIEKLTKLNDDSIGLSEDLTRVMGQCEEKLSSKRNKFDSRAMSLLPTVVKCMKRLVKQ
jgi:hypothetical protein